MPHGGNPLGTAPYIRRRPDLRGRCGTKTREGSGKQLRRVFSRGSAQTEQSAFVEARRLLGALYADHGRPRRFTVAPQFRRLEPACSCWWHHHGRNRITLACVKTRSLLEPSVHVDLRNSRECESNDALHTLYCTSKPSAWQLNEQKLRFVAKF